MRAPTAGRARAYFYCGVATVLALGALTPPLLVGGPEAFGERGSAGELLADTALSNLWGLGLVALSITASSRLGSWGGAATRLPAAAVVVLYAADSTVGLLFGARFFLRDAVAFGGDPGDWIRFLSVGATTDPARLAIACGIAMVGLLCAAGMVLCDPPRPTAALIPAAALAIAVGLGSLAIDRPRRTRVAPALEIALTDTANSPYSTARRAVLASAVEASRDRVVAPRDNPSPRRPDIVLLTIESWSCYHSALFGGANDWTPGLDALAANGLAFTNFCANGLTTEDGIVSIIAGEEPISPATGPRRGWLECFSGFMGAGRALPRLLAPARYLSCWLTTGPIRFSCKHQFLDTVGFDLLSDGSDPFYRDGKDGRPWPQAMFGPPDRALYRRALSLIANPGPAADSARRPLLLVLETTSSHLPLCNPDGPPHDEASVMRHVDRQASAFIGQLEAGGFFRAGGLLIVTSDHRAMTAPRPEEPLLFGEWAPWRVPLFFVADWLPRGTIDPRPGAQTDIGPTLEWLVAGHCPVAGRRCILLDPACPPARFFAARERDARHIIRVADRATGASGRIALAGDRTRRPVSLAEATDWLEWERLAREPRAALRPDIRYEPRHAMIVSGMADPLPPAMAARGHGP